ncbi:SHOCT domain-containing protein, partial [Streptomyces sp. NPDC058964]|uniref:SHOCT domain-containing protein n=1 Tax=Streptomyces sp. NPDC058964 TaxID=3346681 RepID=UPI0036886AF4
GSAPDPVSPPFAAASGGAGGARGPAAVPAAAGRRDPADIAERIRHLGELHRAGLVTDEEFSAKKAELLSEL